MERVLPLNRSKLPIVIWHSLCLSLRTRTGTHQAMVLVNLMPMLVHQFESTRHPHWQVRLKFVDKLGLILPINQNG